MSQRQVQSKSSVYYVLQYVVLQKGSALLSRGFTHYIALHQQTDSPQFGKGWKAVIVNTTVPMTPTTTQG